MKSVCKKIASAALTLCLLCVCLPFSAQADVAYGENVFRRYDRETQSYVFYGNGPMFDFDPEAASASDTYARVVIEAGVTYVGAHLFDNDTIGELVLPDAPITINKNAFAGSVIDLITFPQTAVDPAQYDFGDEFVDFGDACVYGLDLGGLNGFPNGFRFGSGDNYTLQSLIVGSHTDTIPDNACNCFGELQSLTLPSGLQEIGVGAFESCEHLQTVRIPDSVTAIGDYAFDYCTNLESITLPKRLLTIGEWAFCFCEKLTSVIIPDGATSIGISAFEDCASLTEVTIPNSMTSIGINAFSGTGLQNVHLPAGLQDIHASSFGDSLSYVCCDTENCPAVKQFAAEAEIEFRLCDGHGLHVRVAGDADGDGVLTLKDIVLVRRYLADGWDVTIDESSADVDGDGAVTLQDVALMSRCLAGGWNVVLL